MASRVQVVELNEPLVVPAFSVNVTMPDGMLDGLVVSVTVTAQDEVEPVLMLFGVQTTEVDVLSRGTVTVIVADVALLLPL